MIKKQFNKLTDVKKYIDPTGLYNQYFEHKINLFLESMISDSSKFNIKFQNKEYKLEIHATYSGYEYFIEVE